MRTNFIIHRSFMSLLLLSMMTFLINCKKDNSNGSTAETEKIVKNLHKMAALPSTQPPQTVQNGTFLLVNRLSGKVLDVDGAKTADGTVVFQYGATGGANQKWTLQLRSGGYYSAIDVNSGKALQIKDSGVADGDITNIGSYTGSNHQLWQFVALSNGFYRIVNKNSGKVLDVNEGSTDDLGKVHQWSDQNSESQHWALLKTTYNGQLGWTFNSTGVPADAQARITAAMNEACARYNAVVDWPARTLNVYYEPSVTTADGNSNGTIRFGPNSAHQTARVAMHEIAHTYGVGQTGGWYSNTSSGAFLGTNAVATIHGFETLTSVVNAGGGHFWNYGLNYDSEWSETNAYRHVKMIEAMRADGM